RWQRQKPSERRGPAAVEMIFPYSIYTPRRETTRNKVSTWQYQDGNPQIHIADQMIESKKTLSTIRSGNSKSFGCASAEFLTGYEEPIQE
ncbi:MAG: hypothetical protein MKZ95_13485, partial [Pirellulales bacterium]|nr:hypothetical protein [Pirellulales bacterium]